MIEKRKRISDMMELIGKLDISPTMYKDAIEKYKNIGTFLLEKGIHADFYPQGSFPMGLVVRPYKNEDDANYDLDAICQLDLTKESTTPQKIKETIEKAFESDETYKSRLTIYDACCTIQYAEKNEIGFSIDIVSAVDEAESVKDKLSAASEVPQYIDSSIAITTKKSSDYEWATNNPKGYKLWFDEINKPFLEMNPLQSRALIFESHRSIFNSIEDIPLELERSSLQRVIQMLKRHRDVYFLKINDGKNLKPISAIITTLVASIAQTAPANMEVFDLLKYTLEQFDIYSKHQVLNETQFSNIYQNKNIVKRSKGKWIIENPVNPGDNLADAWNENPKIATAFFNWTKCVTEDFLGSMDKTDENFIMILEAALGSNFVRKGIDINKYVPSISSVKPVNITSQSKPWRS